jgi:predicted carbohydrate-binding protein with CBM5 and CBM33 domain
MLFVRCCQVVGLVLVFASPSLLHAHGTVEFSRLYNVRAAGPSGGLPGGWSESYYTWNQNSNNFSNYANPGFQHSFTVPNGQINIAGINDGRPGSLDFSRLETPSLNWPARPASAGQNYSIKFLATAPHEPSYFDVYLTKQGFNVATETLEWNDLELLGRWQIGSANNITLGTGKGPIGETLQSYDWQLPIPADRSGRHELLVIWQRIDPAGEAFFSTSDLNIAPAAVPEPSTLALAVSGAGWLWWQWRRRRSG